MTYLVFGLVGDSCLLKVHCKGYASHKDVRPNTEVSSKWLLEGLKIAQDHWLWPVTVQLYDWVFQSSGLEEY